MTTDPVGPSRRAGLLWGLLGVAAFSLTVPMTRIVVQDNGLDPLFVGSGRAVLAGVLAVLLLAATRPQRPRGGQWARLAVVAAGIVVGFPMLTSYALTTSSASHGAVVIAILPATTAVVVVLRTRERTSVMFWLAAGAGAIAAVGFAALHGGGLAGLQLSDALLLGAVVAGALGYAEGGMLARELGAWQTISWALVLALPLMTLLSLGSVAGQSPSASGVQWLAFLYLGVISMFLGFFAWYRGLAIGPMAQVSQVQLSQPVMTLGWAALLLGESLTWATVAGGLAVILCATAAVRVRLVRKVGS